MFVLGKVLFSFLFFARGFPALVGAGCWLEGGFESFSSIFLLAYESSVSFVCTLLRLFASAFNILSLPIKEKKKKKVFK